MAASGEGVVIGPISEKECHALLERANVGRVGVTIDALPVVLPVNFAIHGDAVIFRSTPGTKLSTALQGTVVAFEVDDYDPNGDLGWSVLIQGMASEITGAEQLEKVRELPLRHISPRGESDHFIRVAMTRVTGRRIRPCYSS